MTRCNIHLPEVILKELKSQAKATGRPMADLIRQALVEYLKLDPRQNDE